MKPVLDVNWVLLFHSIYFVSFVKSFLVKFPAFVITHSNQNQRLRTTTIPKLSLDNNGINATGTLENSFNLDTLAGTNEEEAEEYWYNKKIHTLGNTGVTGALHAAMGPISTVLIDKLAYKGINVRNKVKFFMKYQNEKCNLIFYTKLFHFCNRSRNHYMIW